MLDSRWIISIGPVKPKLCQSASKTLKLSTSIFLITHRERQRERDRERERSGGEPSKARIF